jgi:ribosomal protein L11 methyltransferase
LLDVGTGTAVLAMMAHLEGVGKVVGIEIDPEARRVAKENVLRNELLDVEISDALLEEVRETFDFVVANIIDGVLIRIKNDLLRVLKPGGQIFLTGILTERDNLFFEKFIETSPLQVIRRLEKDEWVGYWLQDTRLHVVHNSTNSSANDTASTTESN